MDIQRLAELLGFQVDFTPEKVDGETRYYATVRLESALHVTPESAFNEVYWKVEEMIKDIIRVNRNLSNEDLAEIMLKKAQGNLLTDLNNTHGDKKDA